MPGLLPDIDPDGLLEYSVVYTDRSLNHMSRRFIGVMQDIICLLKDVYGAQAAAIIPGSGTFGMESIVRQFARDKNLLILRNGWFSYRWSQIIEMGRISSQVTVLKARPVEPASPQSPWEPAPLDEVVETIRRDRPALVFAPHVETASGIVLPDDYVKAVGRAAREVDALFVLDCVASGALWVDMSACDVDLIVTAPQKGWSASPLGAMVMFGPRALKAIETTTSDSFSADLKKWLQIAQGYEKGVHAYHATLPTDTLVTLRDRMVEAREQGFDWLRERQIELGREVRQLLEARGFPSVAAPGFKAPGVVVSYTDDPDIRSGKRFMEVGIQSASGVPLQCDEPASFSTFRLGLFGLDKWRDVDATVSRLAHALDRIDLGQRA